MAPKILVVLTSHNKLDGTDKPTGWYLPEFAHPYDVLAPKAEIVVASPKGGEAPLDPGSVEMFKQDKSSVEFLNTKSDIWKNTEKLSTFLGRSGEFAALFYPGGHGPMYDLATDKDSIALINEFVAAGKPVAAVCHGPAVFTNVVLPSGEHLVKGKEVTGFSNVEEDQVQLSSVMPFLLEDKLKEAGGIYKKAAEPWGEFVLSVDGGKLITGQNPASAAGTGKALLEALGL
ncbi:ThiJ/PfpI family protein [Xylariales sp. PMI_506]|nr:ThiJ/PfpI family protein [Xylariales sp. PMI_506]